MAKNKEKKELQQTYGEFKVTGKVVRIDSDKAYKQEVMQKGKNEGRPYRTLAFTVKTNEENEVRVEMFAYEPKEVYLWNSTKNKEAKERGEKYSGLRVPYEDWKENREEYEEQGYAVLESRLAVDYDEDGKLISKSQPAYLTAKELYNSLENGDDVTVKGRLGHSKYTNQAGTEVKQTRYNIQQVYRNSKAIDFESDDFEEISYFEDEVVFISIDSDPDKKSRAILTGRTIDYSGNFVDNQYILNLEEEGMKPLANNIRKRFKFGDKVRLFGDIINKAEVGEDEPLSEEDEFLLALGGKPRPKHSQRFTFKNYIQELEVGGVLKYEEGFYSEEDFMDIEKVKDETDKDLEDFGGKKKPKKDNDDPFASDDDDFGDDLPF